ncbi:tyrosine recombinase XerC [Nonomuraea sp. NPDC050790]|uniref:tyrosine recombinase XerC n=1 Tax=Nonomuraea sp. NPDC050790 TaxID=3364371 RepID=UPI003790271B
MLLDGKGKPVLEKDPVRYGKGKRYRLRYIGPDGRETNESFGKKVDAERRETEVKADLQRGTYIDPSAGKVIFKAFAADVIANRTLNPSTREKMHQRLTSHVYPTIGGHELGLLAKRPSILQGLVTNLSGYLAPNTIRTIMAHVQLVFAIAVDDELIGKNPMLAKSVSLPASTRKKLVLWTPDQLYGMGDALPERYQAMVDVGSGIGLRQGEIFALSPDDVEWLPGEVHVQRQIKILKNRLVFAPPKGDKPRDVPLAESVKIALAEHMRRFEPVEVTLPWVKADGPPHTARLFFVNTHGRPLHQATFNKLWHRALEQVGIVPPLKSGQKRGHAYREHGMHMLRKYFTSALLSEGESVRAVAEWLGHSDGGALLLRVYASVMPKSEQRMRKIIDAALRRPNSTAHGPQTAHGRPE